MDARALENRRGGRLKKKAKPFWERAYKGHAYWLGKRKLGRVTLLSDDKGKYHWEAAGRAGYSDELDKAKAAVELAVAAADKQLDLFQQINRDG
ncbi:MAG: hypothetical protein A3G81_08390 [Betaproteobacteria bacterium RIFCSPLOWO2_12_FULL_65_14]|nr:MAG: hypothetical protein A3G81_08390 [Betaproteobacteria bacterium RIFCSPLOWO2_12_FULL_65_14]